MHRVLVNLLHLPIIFLIYFLTQLHSHTNYINPCSYISHYIATQKIYCCYNMYSQNIPWGWFCGPLHIPHECYKRRHYLGIYKSLYFSKPKLSACTLIFLSAAKETARCLQRRLVPIPIIKTLNILYSFA